MTGIRAVLESKLVDETKPYTFYFSLPVGVTISSASLSVTVYSGTDAAPSSLLSGADSTSGATVTQNITGGTAGVIYLLQCTATLSDASVISQAGYLAVVPLS